VDSRASVVGSITLCNVDSSVAFGRMASARGAAVVKSRRIAPRGHPLGRSQIVLRLREAPIRRIATAEVFRPPSRRDHYSRWLLGRSSPRARSADYELQTAAPFAAALARVGIATWNIEYRRAGDPGGGWPGSFQDLARATDFLQTIAAKYFLDLKRVISIGHSAGGQLALWLPARTKLPTSSTLMQKIRSP
jgi:hypothetical protein